MRPNAKYLDINPEGKLLREAQDIAEELRIMIGIYNQQLSVIKDFKKCLLQLNGQFKVGAKDRDTKRQARENSFQQANNEPANLAVSTKEMDYLDGMIEEVEDRKNEIEDLEQAALRACQQVRSSRRQLLLAVFMDRCYGYMLTELAVTRTAVAQAAAS